MKLFDFSSPYSRFGLFFGVVLGTFACLATLVESMDGEPSYAYTIDATATEALPWKLKEPPHLDFGDFSAPSSGIPNFREPARFLQGDDAKAPCFTVYIDPTVPGADVDYRGDLFGDGELLVSTNALTDGFKEAMARDFSAEAWARDPNCFDGSFVVSFTVTEEGRIGEDMLVHHIEGQSNQAGISVLDVLRELDYGGYRWHDGTKGTGEVRIPVKFKLG